MRIKTLSVLLTKSCGFTLLLVCFCLVRSIAQQNRKVSGTVTDTVNAGIPYVNVKIVAGKDTLTTQTDGDGNFNFSKISAVQFSLSVSAIGYQDLLYSYSFTEKERNKRLQPIIMHASAQTLREVVIKGKPNPIRFMQDTVEYDAAAFRVNEGDNVADLLKQFPGLEVDDQYHVKVGDKPMVKLRINGKNFFTNDVTDFIAKLPAGIVSKIQVIDDFGDMANFTGIKTGEPQKMLNIVTKPGMNKGTFGNANATAGTNDQIGGQVGMNYWNDVKQATASGNANTANNGAGHSQYVGIGLNYNDKLSVNSNGGISYNFSNNSAAFNREQVLETLSPNGNFTNHTQSEGNSGGSNHNLRGNLNFNNNKVFLQMSVNGAYTHTDNQSNSSNQQTGLLRQDLTNTNSSNNSAPSAGGNLSFAKKLQSQRNSFSATASFSFSGSRNIQHIGNNTRYYDQATGAPLKDSILNRDVESRTNSRRLNFGFNYSLGLNKPKNGPGQQSINFAYNGSATSSVSQVTTFVFNNKTNNVFSVDSLNTSYNSTSVNQSFGISYNYNTSKMRYNLGFNTNSSMLSNHDVKLGQTTANTTINYSPSITISRTLGISKTLSINYQGNTQSPSLNQLQPIRNALTLNNILVGNPDLKTAFSHNLSANFNYSQKSGRSLQLSFNASTIQNEIVSDVILVPDTLNSLKQITRYENINGNYQVGSNYFIHIPIKQNKYSIGLNGRLGFSNHIILFNHQQAGAKGLDFSQQVTGNISFKKFSLNSQLSYTITNNNNSGTPYAGSQPLGISQITSPIFFRTNSFSASLQSNLRLEKLRINSGITYNTTHNDAAATTVIQNNTNINLTLNGQLTILKTYFADFNGAKRLSYGYTLLNPTPLLINAGLGKRFLKSNALNVSINGTDLLGQGNNISRTVSGSTIVDSRNQQPTRVFSLNVSYNISNFGGRNMRVDPD